MGKRSLRKRIRSLERRIAEHEEKIHREAACQDPTEGVVHHWLAELAAFRGSVARAKKRLRKA